MLFTKKLMSLVLMALVCIPSYTTPYAMHSFNSYPITWWDRSAFLIGCGLTFVGYSWYVARQKNLNSKSQSCNIVSGSIATLAAGVLCHLYRNDIRESVKYLRAIPIPLALLATLTGIYLAHRQWQIQQNIDMLEQRDIALSGLIQQNKDLFRGGMATLCKEINSHKSYVKQLKDYAVTTRGKVDGLHELSLRKDTLIMLGDTYQELLESERLRRVMHDAEKNEKNRNNI